MGSRVVTPAPALTETERKALRGLKACASGVRAWEGSEFYTPARMRALADRGLVEGFAHAEGVRWRITARGREAVG